MCVKYLDLDIIGIAETHLTGSDVLKVEEYRWFGSNRQNIHVRARAGSGGVGFLIHNDLCSVFDISIVANIVLVHKFEKKCYFSMCLLFATRELLS